MPTREAIVNTVLPKEVTQPIPVRTISTRTTPKTMVAGHLIETTNPDQRLTNSEAPEESVRLSPQLSALARKEQAFRQREQALKQREKDIEAKLARAEKFDRLEAGIKSNDYSGVEELGANYEGHTNWLLGKQAGEDPQSLKFKAIEDELQSLKKNQEERVEQEFSATVAEYKTEITNLIASRSDDFSSVKELKREDAVLQLILDSWEEENEHLTVEQACKDVEEFLVEQGKLFNSLPKFKPKVSEEESRRLPPPRVSGRTLTNDMLPASGERKHERSLQHMSDSERYAEARRRVMAKRQQQG